MSSTKKVKSAGRYGARYGVGIRRRLIEIEEKQKKPQTCLVCGFQKVKRKAPGIFHCTKCGSTFAGGAYVAQTLTGSIVSKMVNQKSFLPALNQLLQATESHQSVKTLEEAEADFKHGGKKTGKPEKSAAGE